MDKPSIIPLDILVVGALALQLTLSREQLAKFEKYAELLRFWNTRVNLTSIIIPHQIVEKHFLDSLSVSLALPTPISSLIDIGSGAGFPGIPLAIIMPNLKVTLIEAVAKKVTFLKTVSSELGLTNVTILTGRAETLAHESLLREQFDIVVARSVAQLSTLAELTLPFVHSGGLFIAQKSLGSESTEAARTAIEILGGHYTKELTIPLEGLADRRLILIEKIGITPEKFPRRVGVPTKKPLGGFNL